MRAGKSVHNIVQSLYLSVDSHCPGMLVPIIGIAQLSSFLFIDIVQVLPHSFTSQQTMLLRSAP